MGCSSSEATPAPRKQNNAVIAITRFAAPTQKPKPTKIIAATAPPQPATLTPLPTVIATPEVPPTAAATPISTEPPMPTPNAPLRVATVAINPGANTDARTEMLNLHNQTRTSLGLAPYDFAPELQQAAQAQADYLATQERQTLFGLGPRGHVGGDGSTPAQRVARSGYPAAATEESWAFENTAQAAFEWWLGDQFHRPQIVSPRYKQMGVGVAPHPAGGVIFVAVYAAPN